MWRTLAGDGLLMVQGFMVVFCARLCHGCRGELEQIQFLLGHASVQTTERYYVQKVGIRSGCSKSRIVNARAWLDSA